MTGQAIEGSDVTSKRGFTYAELLMSLFLVGSMSTFAVTKVLKATQNHQKTAVVREAVAMLNEVVYLGQISGELRLENFGSYMRDHINALKVCPTNAYDEGCWDPVGQHDFGDESAQPGLVLHNGATLMGLDDWCCELSPKELCNGLIFDWNGDKGPNMPGDDQVRIEINYGFKDGETDWCVDNRRGTVNVDTWQADEIWGLS